MTIKKTWPNGYEVEIVPNDDREGVNAYITHGRFSASLECAADTGVLTDANDREEPIDENLVIVMTVWAEGHGF
jgi:hypothetical protein